jgi:hypothetical protein
MEDTATLELVRDTVGFGEVYHRADGCSTWKCENKQDREKIISYIEEHAGVGFKSTRKYEQFKKWRKANEYYHEHIAHNPESKEKMKEFVEIARDVNKGAGYQGRTVDEIKSTVDQGSLEQHVCGYSDTQSGEPCGQLVNDADELCYRHCG